MYSKLLSTKIAKESNKLTFNSMQRIPNGVLDILLNPDSTSNAAKTPAGGWKTGADAGHITD